MSIGMDRHDSSKLRIVALSIAPTLCSARAELWMASKAFDLYLGLGLLLDFIVMVHLHQITIDGIAISKNYCTDELGRALA